MNFVQQFLSKWPISLNILLKCLWKLIIKLLSKCLSHKKYFLILFKKGMMQINIILQYIFLKRIPLHSILKFQSLFLLPSHPILLKPINLPHFHFHLQINQITITRIQFNRLHRTLHSHHINQSTLFRTFHSHRFYHLPRYQYRHSKVLSSSFQSTCHVHIRG